MVYLASFGDRHQERRRADDVRQRDGIEKRADISMLIQNSWQRGQAVKAACLRPTWLRFKTKICSVTFLLVKKFGCAKK